MGEEAVSGRSHWRIKRRVGTGHTVGFVIKRGAAAGRRSLACDRVPCCQLGDLLRRIGPSSPTSLISISAWLWVQWCAAAP